MRPRAREWGGKVFIVIVGRYKARVQVSVVKNAVGGAHVVARLVLA